MLAAHDEGADHVILVDQWYCKQGMHACLEMHLIERVRRRFGQVIDLHRLTLLCTLADQTFPKSNRMLAHGRDVLPDHVVTGLQNEVARNLVEAVDRATLRIRHGAGVFQNSRQHNLQVESRANCLGDRAKSLEFSNRTREFVCFRLDLLEQPHILNANNCLVGEGCYQVVLLVGEWLDLVPLQSKDTNEDILS